MKWKHVCAMIRYHELDLRPMKHDRFAQRNKSKLIWNWIVILSCYRIIMQAWIYIWYTYSNIFACWLMVTIVLKCGNLALIIILVTNEQWVISFSKERIASGKCKQDEYLTYTCTTIYQISSQWHTLSILTSKVMFSEDKTEFQL